MGTYRRPAVACQPRAPVFTLWGGRKRGVREGVWDGGTPYGAWGWDGGAVVVPTRGPGSPRSPLAPGSPAPGSPCGGGGTRSRPYGPCWAVSPPTMPRGHPVTPLCCPKSLSGLSTRAIGPSPKSYLVPLLARGPGCALKERRRKVVPGPLCHPAWARMGARTGPSPSLGAPQPPRPHRWSRGSQGSWWSGGTVPPGKPDQPLGGTRC